MNESTIIRSCVYVRFWLENGRRSKGQRCSVPGRLARDRRRQLYATIVRFRVRPLEADTPRQVLRTRPGIIGQWTQWTIV